MSGETPIFSRPARRGTTPTSPLGTCNIYHLKLTWVPDQRSEAAPALVELAAVTSEFEQRDAGYPFVSRYYLTRDLDRIPVHMFLSSTCWNFTLYRDAAGSIQALYPPGVAHRQPGPRV